MKIELTRIKTNKAYSEETPCYEAVVTIDGKLAFAVSNEGHGGCDMAHPVAGYAGPSLAEVNQWLHDNLPPREDYGMTMHYDLELWCHIRLEQIEAEKRLDRMIKGKIVLLGEHKGAPALFTIKAAPTPENLARVKLKDGQQIVNGAAELRARALALV